MEENKNTQMLSQEDTSASEEPKTSSPYTRLTREEGRALIAECEAFGDRFMQYLTDNNLLPKPCPAPKVERPRQVLSEDAMRRGIEAIKGPRQTDDDMFVGDLPAEMPDRFLKR